MGNRKKGKRQQKKKKDAERRQWGRGGEQGSKWLERKKMKEVISETKVARCMAALSFNIRKLKLWFRTPSL